MHHRHRGGAPRRRLPERFHRGDRQLPVRHHLRRRRARPARLRHLHGPARQDPGLGGPIQTLAELGPWATTQWSEPITQELNAPDGGSGARLEFYTAGSFTETATGDGILAYLVFEATAIGETTLDLQMPGGTWFLEDVTEQPTPTNLTVSVIPEPSLIVAFALAIGLLVKKVTSGK